MDKVKTLHVFKCRTLFCKYIFKNGKEAAFINGRYTTDIQSEIDEFNAEIALKHPTLYVDDEITVDANAMDPLEIIKQKAIEDYLKTQNAATDKSNDMGTSTPGALNVANSNTIAGASTESNADGSKPAVGSAAEVKDSVAAKLANLHLK